MVKAQVSRANLAIDVLSGVLGDRETDHKSPGYRGKARGHALPLDPIRTGIIADRSRRRDWTTNWLECRRFFPLLLGFLNPFGIASGVFPFPGESRFNGLSGLHTRSTHKLSRKIGVLSMQQIIGSLMQLYSITTSRLKSLTCNDIKPRSVLLQGTCQYVILFLCRIQLCHNCSIHTKKYLIYIDICQ